MGVQKQENICSNFRMIKLEYHYDLETFGKGLIEFIILQFWLYWQTVET